MDYYEFFTTDNKNGWKFRVASLEKYEPKLYSKIKAYSDSNLLSEFPFKEQVWMFIHNLTDKPNCLGCSNKVSFHDKFKLGYKKFCSLDCANNSKDIMISLQKKSIKEKYGVDYYPQHKDFVDKVKATKIERYGHENYNNIEKGKKTKLGRYGNENYNNMDKHKQTCLDRYGVDNFAKSKTYNTLLEENIKDIYNTHGILNYDRDSGIANLKCDDCSSTYEIDLTTLRGRVKYNNKLCTVCNPKGQSWVSSGQQELIDFIKSLGIKNILVSDTKLLNGLELDIYLPDFNLAIEYDGLYWHSDVFKKNDYHLNKTKLCSDNGVQLIHVFEDEFLFKLDIIKSRLKSILGMSDRKIYARKCEIKQVDNKEAKVFLDENHIQGYINSKVKLGLFINGELVSMMTFGGLRKALGNVSKEGSYELLRFSNKKNINVIGGASKLLKHFIKEYNPNYILSYADKRWSNGNLYDKLGFSYVSDSKPNYWYVNNNKREHRFKYRKSNLISEGFNKNMSEKEIMISRGFYRIYDCGNMKFELIV